jgi:hypothetical protein
MSSTIERNTAYEFTDYVGDVDKEMRAAYGLTYTDIVRMAPSCDYYGVLSHQAYLIDAEPQKFAHHLAERLYLQKMPETSANNPDPALIAQFASMHNRHLVMLSEMAHQPDCEWSMLNNGWIIRYAENKFGVVIIPAPAKQANFRLTPPGFEVCKSNDPVGYAKVEISPSGRREVVLPINTAFLRIGKVHAELDTALSSAQNYIDKNRVTATVENVQSATIQDSDDMDMTM